MPALTVLRTAESGSGSRPASRCGGSIGVLSRFLGAAAGWLHGSQRGFILQWTIVVMVVGITVAVPVAALVTRQFSAQGRVEDATRAYYAAEAGILAVAEDLSRGADAAPRPPYDYIPPTVNFDDLVPAISVEPSSFQVLDTIKPVYYTVEGETHDTGRGQRRRR